MKKLAKDPFTSDAAMAAKNHSPAADVHALCGTAYDELSLTIGHGTDVTNTVDRLGNQTQTHFRAGTAGAGTLGQAEAHRVPDEIEASLSQELTGAEITAATEATDQHAQTLSETRDQEPVEPPLHNKKSAGNHSSLVEIERLRRQVPEGGESAERKPAAKADRGRLAGMVSANGKLRALRTLEEVREVTQHLSAMSWSEQKTAGNRIAQYFGKNLDDLDRALDEWSPMETKAFSMRALAFFGLLGQQSSPFADFKNYVRLVRMIEAIDPRAASKDVARLLRRSYYGDSMLQLWPIQISRNEPAINQDLKSTFLPLSLRRGWQEIPGPDGQRMDIGHALVALDAYAQEPNLVGSFKSSLFTDVGDFMTDLLYKVGARGAGNWNPVDQRGNDYGDTLIKRWKASPDTPLSSLLH